MRDKLSFRFLMYGVFLSILSVFVYMYFGVAYAQDMKKSSITLNPSHPVVGDEVIVEAQVHGVDIDTALFTWRINGEVVQQSYSGTRIKFVAGEVGTFYNISFSAEDGEGKKTYQEKSFTVSDISVVWEGVTYTPPFYKGRALPSQGSNIAFQADALVTKSDGTLYSQDELSYAWYISNNYLPEVRGKGKHSVVLKNGNPQEPFKVKIEVKDPQGNVRTLKVMELPFSSSRLVFYEKNPLVGIRYDSAIGERLGVYDGESTIVAEPYYISAVSRFSDVLEYEWVVGDDVNKSAGTLAMKPEGGSGNVMLSLLIKNKNYWLQSARNDVSIDFGVRNEWGGGNPDTEAL